MIIEVIERLEARTPSEARYVLAHGLSARVWVSVCVCGTRNKYAKVFKYAKVVPLISQISLDVTHQRFL
jgi:hypothetical protein